jgi:membrane-bound serine protease (ClpP class)
MAIRAPGLTLLLVAFVLAPALARADARPWVELVMINGSINPAVADYVDDSLRDGMRNGAAAVLIEIDTPGGLLTSAQRIVESLLNSKIPVIAYVAPSGAGAASAGTFIVEAANIAAMAPGTTIGAAHPVEIGLESAKGPLARKIENFTASFARGIARKRGRNEKWIEEAVRKSLAIGENEALQQHVIEIVAPDVASLLHQCSGRRVNVAGGTITLELADVMVRSHPMRLGDRILNVLADPNVMYLLMIGGLLGLYFEFAHPGVYLPGVVGAICLLLALTSFEFLPVNVSGLLLMLLGAAMLVSEAFITSYGILGLGGAVAFAIGSLFLIDTARTDVTISRGIIAGVTVAFAAIVMTVGYIAIRGRRRTARTGAEGLVGEVGEVRAPIAPGAEGRVFIHGELWRAVSDTPISAGGTARVVAVKGLKLEVQGLGNKGAAPR